jgi:transcriptional regulator with XRE-family HTH domain
MPGVICTNLYSKPYTVYTFGMVALAENLKRYRNKAKLSQKELASRIGISCTRISEIESANGNPTVKTLEKIAAALQIDPVDLLRKRKPKK